MPEQDNFDIEQLRKDLQNMAGKLKQVEMDLAQQTLSSMVILAILHDKLKIDDMVMKKYTDAMKNDIDKVILKNLPVANIN